MASGTLAAVLKPSLNWFLVFVPIAVYLEHFPDPGSPLDLFLILRSNHSAGGCAWGGHRAHRRTNGWGFGGRVNATFGNAAAGDNRHRGPASRVHRCRQSLPHGLDHRYYPPGAGRRIFGGGFYARSNSSTLLRRVPRPPCWSWPPSPSSSQRSFTISARLTSSSTEAALSLAIAALLIVVYALSLVFSLCTHKELFGGP